MGDWSRDQFRILVPHWSHGRNHAAFVIAIGRGATWPLKGFSGALERNVAKYLSTAEGACRLLSRHC